MGGQNGVGGVVWGWPRYKAVVELLLTRLRGKGFLGDNLFLCGFTVLVANYDQALSLATLCIISIAI